MNGGLQQDKVDRTESNRCIMKSQRQIKEKKVQRFQAEVSEAKSMVLAEYKGLSVAEIQKLRGKLRKAGAHMRIVKNTLARIALHNLGMETLDGDLGGQIAFVFSDKDAVMGTKVAHEFAKENERFRLLSGWFDGKRIGIDEVTALASLPSRDELHAMLAGTLAAPLMEIVATLIAPLQELIGTLEARAVKLEES